MRRIAIDFIDDQAAVSGANTGEHSCAEDVIQDSDRQFIDDRDSLVEYDPLMGHLAEEGALPGLSDVAFEDRGGTVLVSS